MLAFIINNIFGWQFWLGVLLTILVFLWIFFGGKNYEYIGLAPLKIGVDSSKYIDPSTYNKSCKSNRYAKKQYTVEPVDNTPELPEINKRKIRFTSTHTKPQTFSISSELVDEDGEEEPSDSNYICTVPKSVKSQRSMALGKHKSWQNDRRSKGEQ